MSEIKNNFETNEQEDSGPAQPGPKSVYELIRNDIMEGHLVANERLKISTLAKRYKTSTNPVREALQQLRGEGFVTISPNRGARVRKIDAEFVRDIYEMAALIEPYLTRLFVSHCVDSDVAQLESIQAEMEANNFTDPVKHSLLDTKFHNTMYEGHYNRHAVEQWWKHHLILRTINRDHPVSMKRRDAVIQDHRDIITAVKNHDEDRAAEVIARHVSGAGLYISEQLRTAKTSTDD